MDGPLSNLRSTTVSDANLRRRQLLAFVKEVENDLTECLRTHYQLWTQHSENAKHWASDHVPWAIAECRARMEIVQKLLSIRDAHGRQRDTPAAKIGTLRVSALLAAVAQMLVTGLAITQGPDEEQTPASPELTADKQSQLNALDTLWEKMQKTLEGIVGSRVKDYTALGDILQDVYDAVRNRITQGDKPIEKLPHYVTSVARNKALSFASQNPHEVACVEDDGAIVDPASDELDQDEAAVPWEALESLKEHVLQMPRDERELLVAHIWDELKPQHIVQKLFYLDQTVRDADAVSKRRGALMKSLREQLEDYL